MKRKVLIFALMAMVLGITSCATSKNSADKNSGNYPGNVKGTVKMTGDKVKYKEVRNYFFRNDAEIPSEPLVTTQEQFDRLYSPAAYMGKDGKPTAIDFDKQMVIGVNLPATNDHKDIELVSLPRQGDKLVLVYHVKYGELNMSWTMKPMLLIAIDKQEGVSHCELQEVRF